MADDSYFLGRQLQLTCMAEIAGVWETHVDVVLEGGGSGQRATAKSVVDGNIPGKANAANVSSVEDGIEHKDQSEQRKELVQLIYGNGGGEGCCVMRCNSF